MLSRRRIMEKDFDINKPENRKCDRHTQRRILTINLLGSLSLVFSLISMFLMLTSFYSHPEDNLMMIGLFFSTIVFSLIGLIGGMIGYLKTRIIRKNGTYATTGLVLNLFGIIINALEIIGTLAFFTAVII
jgi:small-conductance mechanosensitive channel